MLVLFTFEARSVVPGRWKTYLKKWRFASRGRSDARNLVTSSKEKDDTSIASFSMVEPHGQMVTRSENNTGLSVGGCDILVVDAVSESISRSESISETDLFYLLTIEGTTCVVIRFHDGAHHTT